MSFLIESHGSDTQLQHTSFLIESHGSDTQLHFLIAEWWDDISCVVCGHTVLSKITNKSIKRRSELIIGCSLGLPACLLIFMRIFCVIFFSM